MDNIISFEKAIEKLEEIVNNLEKGNVTLEESLKLYQEGILLSQHCNKILEEAEGKVAMIMKEDSTYKEIDFSKDFKE